ncbi:hypothetical protein AURDEDRAFT_160835 [Auricularia subglabra TFB-10046 SS5]|nr:hypothetical protein AURDEDRAFT_160835 [Auricularia subglabra TFB-10046 SS5]
MAFISPEGALMGQSAIERIPEEMVLEIAQYLSQKDLRALGETSRRFRLLAQRAGHYVARTVIWNDKRGYGAYLATLNKVIDHATRHNPEINLAIDTVFEIHTSGDKPRLAFAQALGVVFNAVQRALPYLVSLTLTLPTTMEEGAYHPLCTHPAPKLRCFGIQQWLGVAARIPQNLFAGDAPQLRKVSLSLIDAGPTSIWHPVKVFRNVTRLSFSTHGTNHTIPVMHIFPRVKDLGISQVMGCLTSPKIDIAGLKLHWLKLNGSLALLTDSDALDDIPVVEVRSPRTPIPWPQPSSEVSARIEHIAGGSPWFQNAALSVAPPSGAWRRTACVGLRAIDDPLPLEHCAARLTSLTLDVSLVNAFAQTLVVLPALHELLLDVSLVAAGSRQWFPAPQTRCASLPALAQLVVFSVLRDPETVTVDSAKIIQLPPTLGLREIRVSPALTLAGCAFSEQPDTQPLYDAFSSVDVVPRARHVLPAYYETCRYTALFYASPFGWDSIRL